MSFTWSALMPHPPVLIPEVGRGREIEAAKTLAGISELTHELKDKMPEVLLVLSPHQPYAPGCLFVNNAKNFSGSFAMFGAGKVKIEAETSDEFESFCEFLRDNDVKIYTQAFRDLSRDQGSTVPLYFLRKTWGNLPPMIICSPIGLTPEEAFKLGQSLRNFVSEKNFALLASGDLSHRLTPDAPAGYEPNYAPVFEAAVEEALRTCSPSPIFELDDTTLERAGECGLRSVMIMLGLAAENETVKIFSHEWPFGVGYCNALWKN